MIAQLTGRIAHRAEDSVILDVNGVGYEVHLASSSLERLQNTSGEVSLVIYTAVREDNISLFGFLNQAEKKLFLKLLSVSGVGPKLSMGILAGLPSQELIEAIYREDLVKLTSISGIGKKTAERIIVELKDKLLDLVTSSPSEERRPRKSTLPEDLVSALVNLGYNRGEVERRLDRFEFKDPLNFQLSLKESLQALAK